MSNLSILFFILIFSSFAWSDNESQIKKFEDLFIWKISDELKLTAKEEKLVAEIIRDTNLKRTKSNLELETLYKKLKDETSEPNRKVTFSKIRATLKSQLNTNIDELDRLAAGIGLKKLGQYLVLKRDLAEKIKSIWIQNEKKGGEPLPPPKVIEEK